MTPSQARVEAEKRLTEANEAIKARCKEYTELNNELALAQKEVDRLKNDIRLAEVPFDQLQYPTRERMRQEIYKLQKERDEAMAELRKMRKLIIEVLEENIIGEPIKGRLGEALSLPLMKKVLESGGGS